MYFSIKKCINYTPLIFAQCRLFAKVHRKLSSSNITIKNECILSHLQGFYMYIFRSGTRHNGERKLQLLYFFCIPIGLIAKENIHDTKGMTLQIRGKKVFNSYVINIK